MADLHVLVGWSAILAGLLFGTVLGLKFHRDDWLGGYASWRRRLLRLSHVSMVGTGLLNLAAAATAAQLGWTRLPPVASAALILGTLTMPAVCALSSWRRPFRHAFFVPVLSLVAAVADFLRELVGS
jgi:hypothetical protein